MAFPLHCGSLRNEVVQFDFKITTTATASVGSLRINPFSSKLVNVEISKIPNLVEEPYPWASINVLINRRSSLHHKFIVLSSSQSNRKRRKIVLGCSE